MRYRQRIYTTIKPLVSASRTWLIQYSTSKPLANISRDCDLLGLLVPPAVQDAASRLHIQNEHVRKISHVFNSPGMISNAAIKKLRGQRLRSCSLAYGVNASGQCAPCACGDPESGWQRDRATSVCSRVTSCSARSYMAPLGSNSITPALIPPH